MTGQFHLNEILGDLTNFEVKNAPHALYYEGNLSLLSEGRRVAVVGSRKTSIDGKKRAQLITKALASKGFIVVSGLAEGIDTIAHITAIENGGATIAVLGTPLDKVYPKSNDHLLQTIKKDHLAISQFPQNYPFQKKNFPERNRTMALISDATIIIEASESSGTRHQGWEALRIGRVVYILENVVKDRSISWAKEMLDYGAQMLTRDNLDERLLEIPNLTRRKEVAF